MRFASSIPALAVLVILGCRITAAAADEETPAADDSPSEPVIETRDDRATLEAKIEHFTQLNDDEQYEEAATVALQILRLTQQKYGEDAPQVIDPLIDLARAQRISAEPEAAQTNLTTVIELIERYDGPASAELISPLTTLGEIYNESGLYKKAAEMFDRALRLNHVNDGFINFDQLPIMDKLTDVHMSLQNPAEATFYQKAQLEIQQRNLGIDNPETATAYFKLARWYSRAHLYEESIRTYQRADHLIRRTLGKDSVERAEGWQGLAIVYERLGDQPLASNYLRRALRLIEASANDDALLRASALMLLGDSLTLDGKFTTARGKYAEAWLVLPDDAAGNERRDFYFATPVRLAGNAFPRYARNARNRPADELGTGTVVVTYSVNAKGRAVAPSIVKSDPDGLMDKSFLSIYRRSLFRPHYVDGVAAGSDILQAKHEFLYVARAAATDDDSDNDAKSDRKQGELSYPGDD